MNSSIKHLDPSRVSTKDSIYDFVIAVLLASTTYAFALSGGSLALSMVVYGLLFIVFLWAFITNDKFSRLNRSNLLMWLLLVIVLMLNIVINCGNYDIGDLGPVMLRLAGVSMLVFVLQWCGGVLNPERIMLALGVALIPLILYAIILGMLGIGSTMSGRAQPLDIHPNWWGELVFCFSACALAMPNKTIQGAMIGLSLFLLYLVQSRGAFLAVAVTIGVYYALVFKLFPQRSRHYFLYGTLMFVIIAAVLAWYSSSVHIIDFVKNDILLMDNKYRGVGTGFVGRSEGWAHAWEVFVAHPILGQGMDTMKEVHSGFLRLLAEGGVILFAVVFFLTGRGIVSSRKDGNRLAVSIIMGYLVIVITYPRFLNMNLAASIFFMSLFPWRTLYRSNSRPYVVRVKKASR